MSLFGYIISLIGGIAQIGAQKAQLDLARDMFEQGQYWKNVGFQGLQGSIAQRQQAYNTIWGMVYGGVGNTNLSSLTSPNIIGSDRYYYDENGVLKRKDSTGPNDTYVEPHEREGVMDKEENPRARGSQTTQAENTTYNQLRDSRSRLSNPAAGTVLSSPTSGTHSRTSSISGGERPASPLTTSSGISFSPKKKTGGRTR